MKMSPWPRSASSYEVKFNETNAEAIGDVNEDADSEEEEADIN